MNETLNTIFNRKSIRSYMPDPIDQSTRDKIINATLRSPTAGNMMLYSIIEVSKQSVKDILARTCDHQPFIAKAPFVLVFLADYQRWFDSFLAGDIDTFCKKENLPLKTPVPGDLFLACCDALIAAQTSVIAAESLGVGSCYIGDIMENYEIHKDLFNLPQYVFPITMVCFGYPTGLQKNKNLSQRFDKQYIYFKDQYKQLSADQFNAMFEDRHKQIFGGRQEIKGAENVPQHIYKKKYTAAFSAELNRSVSKIMDAWFGPQPWG